MIKLGSIPIEGMAALAPMAGVTDAAMRLLCHECGAAWTVSEMLSAKGWIYSQGKNRNAQELLTRIPGEGTGGLQLFGSEPGLMAEAAELLENTGFDFIDLNFGCPAPKITGNGEGSALMLQPERIGEIVHEVVTHIHKPVTVKIRSGWDENHVNAVEVARICESKGAVAVTVHGRTRNQQYAGKADWTVISNVKEALDIPVFGNGDVRTGEDAIKMLDRTKCDAVLIARGAQGNPWVFNEVNCSIRGEAYEKPSPRERVDMAIRHFELEILLHGEKGGMLEMRKHIAWYIYGIRGAAKLREKVNQINDPNDVKSLLEEYARCCE